MQLPLAKYGDPVLKEKSLPVAEFDGALKKFAEDLTETLYIENGLGLAAPQVGVLKRVFVIDMRRRLNADSECKFLIDGKPLPEDIAMPLVAVNPEVEETGEYIETSEEGCLSFPGIYAEVERSQTVRMEYSDLNGVRHTLECSDLFARCVQHENDHLDGICFVDRLKNKELFKIEGKLRKLRKETRREIRERAKKDGK